VESECQHLEMRWRGEAAARALASLAGAARAADAASAEQLARLERGVQGRGLHSSTFQLNLSRF